MDYLNIEEQRPQVQDKQEFVSNLKDLGFFINGQNVD